MANKWDFDLRGVNPMNGEGEFRRIGSNLGDMAAPTAPQGTTRIQDKYVNRRGVRDTEMPSIVPISKLPSKY